MRKGEVDRESLKELQRLPGVGPSIARDLLAVGIRKAADLKNRDPERLYKRINKAKGRRQDPCLCYVLRCAVYFTSNAKPKPSLLKWWAWKDRQPSGR